MIDNGANVGDCLHRYEHDAQHKKVMNTVRKQW
jgi:hypothetical protein